MLMLALVSITGFISQVIDGSMGMAFGISSTTMLVLLAYSPAAASAIVHLVEIGTSAISGASHIRFGNVDWHALTKVAIPGAIGAFIGATVISNLDLTYAKPWTAVVLLVLGAAVLYRFSKRYILGRPRRARARWLLPLGFAGGFVDAAGGGGWGPIVTTSLTASNALEPRKAIGTTNTAELIIALAASAGFLVNLGDLGLDWAAVVAMLVGGAAAAPLAAWLVKKAPQRILGVLVGNLIIAINLYQLGAAFKLAQPVAVALGAAMLALALVTFWRAVKMLNSENNQHEETLKTVIHIGTEKTGTTSIQHLLYANRASLAKAGVLIPTSLNHGNNFHLAIASYSPFRADGLTAQLGIFNQADLDKFRAKKTQSLNHELLAAANSVVKLHTLLLTSEHFQSRLISKQDIQQLHDSLTGLGLKNFEVLVYLRDPLKIAMSHHGMAIKKGVNVTPDFYTPTNPRISKIVDFEGSLALWAEVFGAESLNVQRYPEGAGPEVLLKKFAIDAGIPTEAIDFSKQEKRNVNLSAEALEILNDINASSSVVRDLASDKWLFNALEKKFPGRGLSPNQATIDLFDSYFADSYARLAKTHFDDGKPLFETRWKSAETLADQSVSTGINKLIARSKRRQLVARVYRKLQRTIFR